MNERINAINEHLEKIGSVFRTADGLTISGYFGNLLILKRTFKSIDDLEKFVFAVK